MKDIKLLGGKPYPLGATWDGSGVNFAIFSQYADKVELCLFESDGITEMCRVQVKQMTGHVWHLYVEGLKPGQLYGYRVYGPYNPSEGHRFNHHKLLIDPYAKAIAGIITWNDALFGYNIGDPKEDLSFNEQDSAPFIPKSVIVNSSFDWEDDKKPETPFHQSVIYEMHVKGFTKMNPNIPDALKGKFAGVSHPASIQYLKELGITAVELLPVHHFVSDRELEENGLSNYWGYNTIGFFAPDVRYSSTGTHGEQVNEFKTMVKELHRAGIEVILDVVYNHTAEGDHMGPTLSFRGIDNISFYRTAEDKRFYHDYTGTGNTLNATQPNVLQLIMDSLRYWILEMRVDGFRFDLAATLARELDEVKRLGSFFDIIHQDPVISQVKLIAEPWDLGPDGYQVGNFPMRWAEWNGKYRDDVRDFWRGKEGKVGDFATRFSGSADIYKDQFRKMSATINFITAHDGFTLNDLVCYNEKHNEKNLEGNKGGADNNRSWNYGHEGPSADPHISAERAKAKRSMLATLLFSQGVPMLLAGDEFSNTQFGNNNGYCQDNEISWLHWEKKDDALLAFVQKLIQLRRNHPVFCRKRWFKGAPTNGSTVPDIAWFTPRGVGAEESFWNDARQKAITIFLAGDQLRSDNEFGEPEHDDSFLMLINASDEMVQFTIPGIMGSRSCKLILTSDETNTSGADAPQFSAGATITISSKVFALLSYENKSDR